MTCGLVYGKNWVSTISGGLDSIRILGTDLIDTGKPVYEPAKDATVFDVRKMGSWVIGVVIICAIFLPMVYYGRKWAEPRMAKLGSPQAPLHEVQPQVEHTANTLPFRSNQVMDLLDEREKELLEFIYQRSSALQLTSIEEINRVIGVANRSIEIQKRMRSDLISSINEKLSLLTQDIKPVVDKQRSEFDKRSFDYFVRPDQLDLVKKLINKDLHA